MQLAAYEIIFATRAAEGPVRFTIRGAGTSVSGLSNVQAAAYFASLNPAAGVVIEAYRGGALAGRRTSAGVEVVRPEWARGFTAGAPGLLVGRSAAGAVVAAGWDCEGTREDAAGWLARGLQLEFVTRAQLESIPGDRGLFSTMAPVGDLLSPDEIQALQGVPGPEPAMTVAPAADAVPRRHQKP